MTLGGDEGITGVVFGVVLFGVEVVVVRARDAVAERHAVHKRDGEAGVVEREVDDVGGNRLANRVLLEGWLLGLFLLGLGFLFRLRLCFGFGLLGRFFLCLDVLGGLLDGLGRRVFLRGRGLAAASDKPERQRERRGERK